MNRILRSDFFYELPSELIAQFPAFPRDHSNLLVYSKSNDTIQNKKFYDIYDLLSDNDVLIINNTKVIPARLFANTTNGIKVEVLLLKRFNSTTWEVLAKPGKKLKIGTKLFFGDIMTALVIDINYQHGTRVLEFSYNGVFEEILEQIGQTPLPPYINNINIDKSEYQTVYAMHDGSSAAPTAGLHFTDELIEKIKLKGIKIIEIVLHVGLGTFRPVKENDITNHKMHEEYVVIDSVAASEINKAKSKGKRLIAVGTTTVRALESFVNENNEVIPTSDTTNIFIYPPYKFKVVDALITNFHLPESTLLMLVSSFLSKDKVLEIYEYAIKNNYRFFSFGDAMFLYW